MIERGRQVPSCSEALACGGGYRGLDAPLSLLARARRPAGLPRRRLLQACPGGGPVSSSPGDPPPGRGFGPAGSTRLKVEVVSDHGPSGEMGRRGHDEVSVARAGDDLGWPTICSCERAEGLLTPLITWKDAVPPGGAVVYRGSAVPGWKGSVLIASLGAKHLHRLVLSPDASSVQSHEVYLQGEPPAGLGRLRDVVTGPDGALYLTTSNCDGRGSCPQDKDRVVRITGG